MASIVDVDIECDWPAKHLLSPSGHTVARSRMADWVPAAARPSGLEVALRRLATDESLDERATAALCRRAYEGSVRPLLDHPDWRTSFAAAASAARGRTVRVVGVVPRTASDRSKPLSKMETRRARA